MFGKTLCKIGIHNDAVANWSWRDGVLCCKRCDRLTPMTGAVLAEWIRYRSNLREFHEAVNEIEK